jgi:hypothetical protein
MAVRKWVAVNAHASDPLTNGTCDGIYCGVSGTVVAKSDDHATDVSVPAVAGGYLIGRFSHVRSGPASMFALYEG